MNDNSVNTSGEHSSVPYKHAKLLTPVLELYIRLSSPDCEENDIFKFPGPISMVSFF